MRRLASLVACALVACTSPIPGTDAASTDAAGTARDAVSSPIDASSLDAAHAHDASSGDAAHPLASGTIVPLYTDPSSSTWTQLASAARAHPSVRVVAVANPNSGPTPTADPAYTTGIASLRSAGVVVLGYVATGYGTRATSAVAADIDLYAAEYPTLDGIFFDEAAIYETGHEAAYTTESAHARTAGFSFLVANPGTAPIAAYAGLFDVALVYESNGAPAASTLAGFASTRSSAGIIPYAVATLDPAYVASIRPDVEYVYLTDDDLPNPWDTLPSYLDALLIALE